MDVGTTTWQKVGAGAQTKLTVQNVGVTRLGWVFSATDPGANSIALDSGAHGVLNPGSAPWNITGLDSPALNLYVRSLGSKQGKLYAA